MIDCLQKVAQEHGIFSIFTGYAMSSVGLFFYRALYFGLYDCIKPLLGPNPGTLLTFFLGMAVTQFSGIATYPIDTIRRYQMVLNLDVPMTIKHIFETRGLQGFFAGQMDNLFRGIIGALVLQLAAINR